MTPSLPERHSRKGRSLEIRPAVPSPEIRPAGPSPPTRVMVVDSHGSFYQALAIALRTEPDIRVVGHAHSPAAAAHQAAAHRADVAMVDLLNPVTSAQAVASITHGSPRTCSLVMVGQWRPADLGLTVEAGAQGIVPRSIPLDGLVRSLRSITLDNTLISDSARRMWDVALAKERQQTEETVQQADRLTSREREVLQQLAWGNDKHEVAEALCISPYTVQTHIRNLLSKLDVSHRLAAVAKGINLGLVRPPPTIVSDRRISNRE